MTRSFLNGVVLALVVVSLGGCTDFRRALGIEKAPPDEFTVVQNAPLTLPPDYGLRPPRTPGRPATPSPTAEARATVFKLGGNQPADGGDASGETLSPGEQALVTHAGGTGSDPRIRQQVDAETQQVADASDSFIDYLLFWQSPKPAPGEPVDAPEEAARLRENQATGKSVTADEPPAERTHRSILEGLF